MLIGMSSAGTCKMSQVEDSLLLALQPFLLLSVTLAKPH